MSLLMRRLVPMLASGILGLAAAAERVQPLEPDSFRQIVEAHRGKPFVIVLWSLDCDYCAPSFKALAEVQRHRALTVVTIATDRAADAGSIRLIGKKLKSAGLHSEPWAFGSAPAEQLRYTVDPKWHGEMPRSYWFDGQGNAKAHSGVINREFIESRVQ